MLAKTKVFDFSQAFVKGKTLSIVLQGVMQAAERADCSFIRLDIGLQKRQPFVFLKSPPINASIDSVHFKCDKMASLIGSQWEATEPGKAAGGLQLSWRSACIAYMGSRVGFSMLHKNEWS